MSKQKPIISRRDLRPVIVAALAILFGTPTSVYPQSSGQFLFEIEGITLAQDDIRAVILRDATVDLVSTGTSHLRKETISPARLIYGNVAISARGTALSQWLTAFRSGDGRARNAQISVLSNGSPVFYYTLYGVRPLRMAQNRRSRNVQTLIASVTRVGWEGAAYGLDGGPNEWEWAGVSQRSIMEWQERTVSVTTTGDGIAVAPATTADASHWEFQVRTSGIQPQTLTVLEEFRTGPANFPVQTQIIRNAFGAETGRRNYFESFVSRYRFPLFNKDQVQPLSEMVTFLSPRVTDGNLRTIFNGAPLPWGDPVLTNRFRVEIEGVRIPQIQIESVQIGDLAADIVAAGAGSYRPGAIRYGDLVLRTRGSTGLSNWLESGSTIPRSASIIALGRDGIERFRYNVYEIVPVSVEQSGGNIETLTARVKRVDFDGRGTIPQDRLNLPQLWEWQGVTESNTLLDWTATEVTLAESRGAVIRSNASPGSGSHMLFSAMTAGVNASTWDAIENSRTRATLTSHSRIDRNVDGVETDRTNYYDAFIVQYTFPKFDKQVVSILSEQVSFLSSAWEQAK